MIQVRERDLDAREYLRLLKDCVTAAEGTNCQVLVNDRIDLALAADAHGVHLRELSVPVAAARTLAREKFVVGRSVHDAGTAASSRDADYLIAGSVFATASKPGQGATLGLEGLQRVVDAAGECRVFAVGGITPDRVVTVRARGARGIAAIDAFLPGPDSTDIEGDVRRTVEAFQESLGRTS
jgi:thiamine-phosphate diphosphorylase